MKVSKSRIGLACLLLLPLLSCLEASAQSQDEAFLKRFQGTWQGDGKAFGMPARLDVKWDWVTDTGGKAEFQTIYPGWYRGRNLHVHYKIRTNPTSEVGHEFTSQLFFDEAVTDQIHSQAPYAQKGRRDTTTTATAFTSVAGLT